MFSTIFFFFFIYLFFSSLVLRCAQQVAFITLFRSLINLLGVFFFFILLTWSPHFFSFNEVIFRFFFFGLFFLSLLRGCWGVSRVPLLVFSSPFSSSFFSSLFFSLLSKYIHVLPCYSYLCFPVVTFHFSFQLPFFLSFSFTIFTSLFSFLLIFRISIIFFPFFYSCLSLFL